MGNYGFRLVRPEITEDTSKKISISLKIKIKQDGHWWAGKKHTAETIQKQKETFIVKQHQAGEKNSQFGTCWIRHSEHGNKKIKKEELDSYLEQGWIKGRKLK